MPSSSTNTRLSSTSARGAALRNASIRLWWVGQRRPSSNPTRAASNAPEQTHAKRVPGATLRSQRTIARPPRVSLASASPATPQTTSSAPDAIRSGNGSTPVRPNPTDVAVVWPGSIAAVARRRKPAPKSAAMRNASAAPAKSSRTTPGGSTNQTSVVGEDGIDVADAGKAAIEHQLRMLLDLVHIVMAAAAGVDHREGQGRFGHEVDIEAEVGGDAAGGFATLFGADAGDDHAANAALAQPRFKPGIGECVVHAFAKRHRGIRRHPFHRPYQPRSGPERSIVVLLMQDAHDRPVALDGAMQQAQHGIAKRGQVIVTPVRAAQERLLDIDGEHCGRG